MYYNNNNIKRNYNNLKKHQIQHKPELSKDLNYLISLSTHMYMYKCIPCVFKLTIQLLFLSPNSC